MKKLYAKTSFSSKSRSSKNAKNENDYPSSDLIKYHDPILAYQPSKAKDFPDPMKYKPKHPFAAKLQNLEHLRNPQFSVNENSSVISSSTYDESPYYYTITELENLHMLDHRHPHFHQQHRMQQQQHQQHTKVYHQHNQLVLQLPVVSAAPAPAACPPSLDAVDGSLNPMQRLTSPIYEAPQMNSSAPASMTTPNGATTTTAVLSSSTSSSSVLSLNSSNVSSSPSGPTSSTNIYQISQTQSTSPLTPPHQQHHHHHDQQHYGATLHDYDYDQSHQQYRSHAQQTQHRQQHHLHQQHQQLSLSLSSATSTSSSIVMPPRDNLSSKVDFMANSISPTLFIEQSIIGARASVMVYDDIQKKWIPAGSSSGLSKVQIYHHQQNNTFRVVGRKLQDHEVVINCSILKGLKYNQATATFHQWRDSKYVYGLNFSSPNDAEAFARAMMHALDVLSGRVANIGLPTNGNGYEEDMGYRTMTSEDAAILRQQQQITGQVTPSAQTPTSQTNQNNIPQSPPTPQQGHHRTSRNSLSAPPAPQPPQMQQQQTQQQQQHSIYGHTTGNGPTQNGMQQHPLPQQQQQLPPQQIPPVPGQPQYHGQPQMQLPPPQQQQQQQQQQQLALYATQQMVNAGGYQQQPNQYQQSHYVLSNSNPNLNMHQYPQQQPVQGMLPPQAPQPPMPPPHQNGGGPMYMSAQQQMVGPGIPNSQSANNVYVSQPQMGGGGIPMPPQPPQPPAMPNGPPAPPHAYGQMNGSGQVQQTENPYGQVPAAPPMMPPNSNVPVGNIPMPPPLSRMSSSGGQGGASGVGAPAPPPPPSFGGSPPMFNGNVGGGGGPVPPPPQPPAPPAPPAMGGGGGGPAAPPPPPPPPMGGGGGGGGTCNSNSGGVAAEKKSDPQADLMGSLAAQLQQAKLKKKSTPAPTETSGNSTPSGGSGNYGTIGRGGGGGGGGGMASMMDEMAKTLARRRAQAEKKEPDVETTEVKQRPWEKSNTLPHKLGSSSSANSNSTNANSHNTSNSGSESPRPMRKRFGSASEETILKVNGDGLSVALSGSELEQLKAEIVREMKVEIQKVKQEIIDAIKSEFNRR